MGRRCWRVSVRAKVSEAHTHTPFFVASRGASGTSPHPAHRVASLTPGESFVIYVPSPASCLWVGANDEGCWSQRPGNSDQDGRGLGVGCRVRRENESQGYRRG